MADTFDYDIFISYSSADKDWVRGELLTRLESKGLRVCIDFRDFQVGAPSVKEMQRAVQTSVKTILVLTPNYLASAWTEFEVLMLQTLDPANRQLRLLPLVKEKCDLPLSINYLTHVNFTDVANLDFAWTRLLNAIKAGLGDSPSSSLQSPVSNAPIPRPPQYGFVARYDDQGNDIVEQVVNLLNQNRAVALLGSGGLGKTTLAAEIARKLQHDGMRVIWTSADGRSDFSLVTLLDEAVTQLGNPDVRKKPLEEKTNDVRGLLTQSPTVVVIDNFETVAAKQQKAMTDFIETLSCAVLVTSRTTVEHAERVNIGAMTLDEAREFLRRQIASSSKKNALTPLIDEIANLAERNPMVMRWIVGQMERAQRMSDVLDELSRGQGDAAAHVFGRSFRLLSKDAQATLLSLALFVPSANRTALAFTAGFGDDIKRLNDALKPLADLQLLETDANNECLSVVGLTRRFTNGQLNKDANAANYRKRFVDYFVNYAEAHAETTPEDLNALEDERENLLVTMDMAFAAENWQSVIRMMVAIGKMPDGLLQLHGYWDEAIARGEQATDAARRARDESAVARFTGNVAIVLKNRGEYDKARLAFEQLVNVFQNLRNELKVAVALHQLGMIAQDQGDYVTARAHYGESLETFTKLDVQMEQASVLHQLGMIAQAQGDYEAARAHYAESLEITGKLGNQRGIESTLHQLGIIAQDQGDYATAQTLYAESLKIAKNLGDQSGIASTLHQLGMLAQQQGDYKTARTRYAESLDIAKKLGDQRGIAATFHQLGAIFLVERELLRAEEFFNKSLTILKKLGNEHNIAECLESIGKLRVEQKQFRDAESLFTESLSIAQSVGDRFRIGSVKHSQGLSVENQGNKTEAARLFREALEIFELLKSPDAKIAREALERVEGAQRTTSD